MTNIKYTLALLVCLIELTSCAQEVNENKSDRQINEISSDKAIKEAGEEQIITSSEAPIGPNIPSYVLPGEVIGEDYSVKELATIQHPETNLDYTLYLIDDERLAVKVMGAVVDILELVYGVPNVNINAASTINLSFANITDRNAEENMLEDELIITYETIEMNNGVYNGFENEFKGFVILDFVNERIAANILTTERITSYSAPDIMPSNQHGKSFEGTSWEICNKQMDYSLSEGFFTLTNFYLQSENFECTDFKISEGKYVFNKQVNGFELTRKF